MARLVLIVDDDAKSLKLTRDLLNVSGYATIEASDGKKAVELARNRRPDLILMDLHMPVMDGLEATRTIKGEATTRDIPVIATTASAMQGDEDRAIQAGCDGYLTKPIDIKELLNKVEGYLSAKQHKSDYSETGG